MTAEKNLEHASDTDLVAAINAGDADAFEILYFRHRDWVAGLACRFTGDSDAALDVLQETFLYLLRKFPGFRLTSNLKTFLYPAVRHLAIAARQKTARYQGYPSDLENLESQAGTDSAGADPGDLKALLAGLPEEQREVLMLRFFDGFSLAEIAQAIEIPLGTVKSRLHNSLQTLRNDPRTRKFFEE